MWLTPGSDWARRYAGWKALRKLEYVDALMREIAGKEPRVRGRREVEPLASLGKTLREHYEQRRESYGVGELELYDRDLRRLFSDAPEHARHPSAARFLSRLRKEAGRRVRRWTGSYQYLIDRVLGEMIERCRELNLRLAAPEEQAKQDFLVLLAVRVVTTSTAGATGWRCEGDARMKKQRVLALVDESLVPPDDGKGHDVVNAPWKMEFDVVHTLREEGHEVLAVGVGSELGVIRRAIQEFKPDIAFNLLEGFADVATWDQNVVAYLELMRVPYTGCNSRGLLLARDKALAKKILAYHRIPVPDFVVVPRGRPSAGRAGWASRSSSSR